MMTHDPVETDNDKLVDATSSALDQSIESLSPNVQSRLQQARENALNHQTRSKLFANLCSFFRRQSFTNQALEAGLAFCLLALMVFPIISSIKKTTIEQPLASSNSALGEFILLSNFDDTELEVIEDIEFAYWLSQEFENENDIDRPHNGALYDNAVQHNG